VHRRISLGDEGGRRTVGSLSGIGISDYKADDAEIKRTYRQMALKLHPDKNSAPRADEALKAVGNAYEMLSDQEKRRVYDMTGEEEILNGWHQQAAEAEQHPQTEICCFFCLFMFLYIGISASIGVICGYSPSVGLILLICWFGCIGCLPVILGTNCDSDGGDCAYGGGGDSGG